jgi:hypothetical protein
MNLDPGSFQPLLSTRVGNEQYLLANTGPLARELGILFALFLYFLYVEVPFSSASFDPLMIVISGILIRNYLNSPWLALFLAFSSLRKQSSVAFEIKW